MRDAPPPPAALKTVRGEDAWVCYWCEALLTYADFSMLDEREVWKCRKCGHFQTLGSGERVRNEALEAEPGSASQIMINNMQQAYNRLERPSQRSVSELTGYDRKSQAFKAAWSRLQK